MIQFPTIFIIIEELLLVVHLVPSHFVVLFSASHHTVPRKYINTTYMFGQQHATNAKQRKTWNQKKRKTYIMKRRDSTQPLLVLILQMGHRLLSTFVREDCINREDSLVCGNKAFAMDALCSVSTSFVYLCLFNCDPLTSHHQLPHNGNAVKELFMRSNTNAHGGLSGASFCIYF